MSLSWKSVKKKFEKNLLLQNYVLSLRVEHELSLTDAQKCLKFIISAINMKQIVSDNIKMKDGQISHIENFNIIDGKYILDIKDDIKIKKFQANTKPFTFLGFKWREYKNMNM
jgi:hypothetical protein